MHPTSTPSRARVHLFGIAYKKDVSDMRESPALDILQLLHRRGAELSYTDPYVPSLQEGSVTLRSIASGNPANSRAISPGGLR